MKHTERFAWFIAILSTIAFVLAAPVYAQETDNAAEAGIPAYSIARLKVLAGSVWVRSPDGKDWAEAPTNSPLTPNSRISIPEGSEGELQFHGGQFVLLTSGTDLEVGEMAEDKTSFRIRAGEIRFDLPGSDFAPVSVRVPGGARTSFAEPGRYWITVTDDDVSRLVVRRGSASVSHEGSVIRMSGGEEAMIGREVTLSRSAVAAEEAPPPEELSEAERAAGVPPVVGQELQEYGEWVQSPTHGYVWSPHVAPGWSPYVYGRWTWVVPYGWVWVSYEPWGWYPYHSGFWLSDPLFGWVWTPHGSFVSFGFGFTFGHHHHFHHGFHFRHHNARFIHDGRDVRWVPLRPGERFRSGRSEFPRGDSRLTRFNRPLESGQVFVSSRGSGSGSRSVSGSGSGGGSQRELRDVTAVRAERQTAIRSGSSGSMGRDVRPVRPELQRRGSSGSGGRPQGAIAAPRGDGQAVQRPSSSGGLRSRDDSSAPRVTAPRGSGSERGGSSPRVTTPRGDGSRGGGSRDGGSRGDGFRDGGSRDGGSRGGGSRGRGSSLEMIAPRSSGSSGSSFVPRDIGPAPSMSPGRGNSSGPRVVPRGSTPIRSMDRAPAFQQRSGGSSGGGGIRSGGGGSRGGMSIRGGGGRGGGDFGGGRGGGRGGGGRGIR